MFYSNLKALDGYRHKDFQAYRFSFGSEMHKGVRKCEEINKGNVEEKLNWKVNEKEDLMNFGASNIYLLSHFFIFDSFGPT